MKQTVILFGCVVMLAATAQAVEITNKTTGTLLFYDNFENLSITPSTANAYDGSVDADPIATVGSWIVHEDNGGEIQVTTSAPAQGSRDLRIYRDSGHQGNELDGILTSPQ